MDKSVRDDPRLKPLLQKIDPYIGGKSQELSNFRQASRLLIDMVDAERAKTQRLTLELDAVKLQMKTRVLELQTTFDAQIRKLEATVKERDDLLDKSDEKISKLNKSIVARDEIIEWLTRDKYTKASVRAHPYRSAQKLSQAIAQLESLHIDAEQGTQDSE